MDIEREKKGKIEDEHWNSASPLKDAGKKIGNY